MTTPEWCPEPEPTPTRDPASVQNTFNLSYLCEKGWQAQLITGFLRDLLIRQWTDSTNIIHPMLKKSLWSAENSTGILIETVHRYQPTLVGKRPAIMIKRNPMKNMKLGLLNKIHGGGDFRQIEKGAFERFATVFVGSHTLFCISRTSPGAEILATEVANQVMEFSPVISRDLNLRFFSVTDIDTIHELEEETENYVVPVNVGWMYEHSWELKRESLPLKTISLASILGDNTLSTGYQGP